jgi:hypothetical protein
MKTIAFEVHDEKDLTTLINVIKKFGYDPQIKVSMVKEPSTQLKRAIEEVENGQTTKCKSVNEMMEKLNK